jgi:SpoVK/Ycf46/Vps4 family AAA+-type ATPase
VFATFLTWLNEKKKPVFVVATANDISNLPPELLRKGRLDEIFYVDLPTAPEREEIFRIHIARRSRDPQNFDLPKLAGASEAFSGAEIEESINSGLYEAFYAETDLTTEHILHALGETVPLSRTMSEQIERQRAWVAGRARDASRPRPT